MRKSFPKVVEEGRLRSGYYGTPPSEIYGAFRFKIPGIGSKVQVIVDDGAETGWEHVSVSMLVKRLPFWNEMCAIKDLFWEPGECVVQYHPALEDYVNVHEVLHLWRAKGLEFPTPPRVLV